MAVPPPQSPPPPRALEGHVHPRALCTVRACPQSIKSFGGTSHSSVFQRTLCALVYTVQYTVPVYLITHYTPYDHY